MKKYIYEIKSSLATVYICIVPLQNSLEMHWAGCGSHSVISEHHGLVVLRLAYDYKYDSSTRHSFNVTLPQLPFVVGLNTHGHEYLSNKG